MGMLTLAKRAIGMVVFGASLSTLGVVGTASVAAAANSSNGGGGNICGGNSSFGGGGNIWTCPTTPLTQPPVTQPPVTVPVPAFPSEGYPIAIGIGVAAAGMGTVWYRRKARVA